MTAQRKYNIVEGFNIIAPAYDLANDAMTFGLHRLWRRKLITKALHATPQGGSVLDLATGTGDVLLGLVKQRGDINVTGVDPSVGMLDIAKQKLLKHAAVHQSQVTLQVGDGRSLQFPDNTFDTVTISWGIRNIKPFADGLREIHRVLKPGGSIFILESGQPEWKVVSRFYRVYSKLLPYIGSGISGYKPAYQYYTQSVDEFPSGQNFTAELLDRGFLKANYQALIGGIVYLYHAIKPGP